MNVPILTYHALGAGQSPVITPAERFAAHITALANAGYAAVTMAQLQGIRRDAPDMPSNIVALTFDDGYAGVYDIAYPILKAHGMTATVYVISDFVGGDNRWRGQSAALPTLPLMTWDQVSELADNGWEIGAHTRTHPPLTRVDSVRLEDQVAGSQWMIQAKTGRVARSLSYPYGAVNKAVREAVARYYDTAVTTRLAVADDQSDRLRLPRIDGWYVTPGVVKRLHWTHTRIGLELIDMARVIRRVFRRDWGAGITW